MLPRLSGGTIFRVQRILPRTRFKCSSRSSLLRSCRSSSGTLREFIHVIYSTFLFTRIHKRRHAILWWSEEAVWSLIHFTANFTSSRLTFRIVELVKNVGLPPCQRRESRRPLLLHCVLANLEAAARKPPTNLAFESAGFVFVSSTSPKELVNIGRPHPLSSSTKVLPQADPRTYKSASATTLFPAAVLTRYTDHFFSVP